MQHLALGHQLGDRRGSFLDGGARVNPVLVVQVDAVRAEPPEGTFDSCLDVGRSAVHGAGTAAGMGNQPELGGNDDVVTAAGDSLADDFFAVEGTVDLRGIDVGDAQV